MLQFLSYIRPLAGTIFRLILIVVGSLIVFSLWIASLDQFERGGHWGYWIIIGGLMGVGWWFEYAWGKQQRVFSQMARDLLLSVVDRKEVKKTEIRNEVTAFARHFVHAPQITLDQVAHGVRTGRPIKIFQVSTWVGAYYTFTGVQVKTNTSFPGWALLQPKDSSLQKFSLEPALESNEFNEQTRLFSSSKKDAFLFFTPDLMEWYMRGSFKPWVYVEGHLCTIVHYGNVISDIPKMLDWFEEFYKYMQHSGALVKKAEPLFPRIEG